MAPSPPDIFHVTRDERYLQLLREEEKHWDNCPLSMLDETPPARLRRHQNERLTGDAEREWFETISDYGDFRRGCVLGAGPGGVESHLLRKQRGLHLAIYDISNKALARVRDRLEQEHPGRVETRQADLNFVELPGEAYDLVLSQSCIHHLVNLEHLAFQINQALEPNGHFFMKEHVGESRFQYSEEKKRLYELFRQATQKNPAPIHWPDENEWTYSPFESVRSGEILDVFGRYLREVRLGTSHALVGLTRHERQQGGPPSRAFRARVIRRLLRVLSGLRGRLPGSQAELARLVASGELLFLLDGMLSDEGLLRPAVAFGVYSKRREEQPAEEEG